MGYTRQEAIAIYVLLYTISINSYFLTIKLRGDTMNEQEIIEAFNKILEAKSLPVLKKILPLCEKSIENFHIGTTAIAQNAIKELLQLLSENKLNYATALEQGLIDVTLSLLVSRFNSVLPLDYPFLVAMVQEKNHPGVCLKAIFRKDIPCLRESLHTNIIPFITINTLFPGPLLNFKIETLNYLNRNDEDLPKDPTV